MAKKYMYRLFGLNILSEIKFDGVDEYKFEELDVVINQKEKLEDDKTELGIKIYENKIIYKKRTYTTIITDGNKIDVFGYIDTDEDWLRHIVLESWILQLWLQRGAVVFHGSVVNINGKAVIFMGDGGAGKSTISYYFTRNGHKKLSDDLCIIIKKNNIFYTVPSSIKQNFTHNTLDIFQMEKEKMRKMGEEEKYTSMIQMYENEIIPIGELFFIEKGSVEIIKINKIKGFSKMSFLLKNLQQLENIKKIEKEKGLHMKIISDLVKNIEMYSLIRAEDKMTLEEIYFRIMKIQEEE